MLPYMRTTVRLDANLLAEAKKHAAESGTTLTALIEDALRELLARSRLHAISNPVRLVTVKGGGLRTGVSLDSGAILLDRMDS